MQDLHKADTGNLATNLQFVKSEKIELSGISMDLSLESVAFNCCGRIFTKEVLCFKFNNFLR